MINVRIEGILPVTSSWLREFIESLKKQKFKPNFTRLSKDTKKSISTVYDFWNNLEERTDIECFITIKERDKPMNL